MEDDTAGRWLDVNSAAEELGVSTDAVRKRISRGSLRSDRKDGTVRVWLDDGGTESGREAQVDGGALVEVLREQAEYLRKQLHEEREARRRADTIIAQLARANEEQARTIRELEVPREEASEAAETVEEEPDRAEPGSEPRSAAVEAQDELGAERARREMAETTLHEGMAEERRRREEAERERDELRRELIGRRERTEAPETVEETPEGTEPRPATEGAEEGARRPWWRRMFRN